SATRRNRTVPGRRALADPAPPRLSHEVARRGFAQEVDVEVDGHGQRYWADGSEHRHIHGKIGERHHGRTGDRAARPYRTVAERLAYPTAALPHGFNAEPAVGMKTLRKLAAKKALKLLNCHHDRHAPPPRGNRTRRLRTNEKVCAKGDLGLRGDPPRPKVCPCPRSRSSGFASACDSCLAELLAQLVLGPHQVPLAGGWQALAGAVDVEREHGQRGAKCVGLAAPAFLGRSFQG